MAQENVSVVFEDPYLLVVNKPAGLKVHGREEGEMSLESLVARAQEGRRAILLHRLDRDTTGLVLFAKRKDAAGPLSRAFEEKRIRKSYWAVVKGRWPKGVTKVESFLERDPRDPRRQVSSPAGPGRRAVTTFRVLAASDEKTWLEVIPKTGRTHQIRVHCAATGHAILGDPLYGDGTAGADAGLALHAERLLFRHPMTDEELDLHAPPPPAWRSELLAGLPAGMKENK